MPGGIYEVLMYLISNSQVNVMPVRKNIEGSEPEDVLLAVLVNRVPTGLEHNASWMTL